MSRRPGQNPSVRTRLNRTKGVKEYFFQYWVDVPGQEERSRETEVIGPVATMTKSADSGRCRSAFRAHADHYSVLIPIRIPF